LKKAIVSVINDLTTDQRVHRHCLCLADHDYQVQLVGRTLANSQPVGERDYSTFRFKLPFETGPLFYASFNLRLFLHLLFSKADLLFSNDLDTLLPNYLVSKLKRVDLIYDSHELFSEVSEVQARPRVQGVWKWLEKTLMPRLSNMMTVNRSIADTYKKWYGVDMKVHRNLPMKKPDAIKTSRTDLDLPIDKKIIVLQGAGINVDRGAEEAVLAMQFLNDHLLLIIGSGDVIDQLKEMVTELNLADKVKILGKKPYDEMMKYTACADLGLSLDKDTSLNYRFSLPNKLFDYIQVGTPVLVSNLPELAKVVTENGVGELLESHDPKVLADQIERMLSNEPKMDEYAQNCRKAGSELVWENERKVLDDMINEIDG
jgi:glycosyltransferase involved in cell wall biosynthesis